MSEWKEHEGAAFPQHAFVPYPGGGGVWTNTGGMSLRAYIATAALASIGTWMPCHPDGSYPAGLLLGDEALDLRAEWAVRQADALLSALKGKE